MYRKAIGYLHIVVLFVAIGFVFIFAGAARAQRSGGELGGGAGIFRPKNPEAKRSATNPSKPGARSTRPTRPNPAEVEERFEDALADANDARDARKFAA